MEVRTGDVIEVVTNKVQRTPRRGTVDDVLQHDPLKLEISWDDGHATILEPRGGNVRVIERD